MYEDNARNIEYFNQFLINAKWLIPVKQLIEIRTILERFGEL